jgi:hypothetical protein
MVLMIVSLSMFLTPALFVIHDRLIARLRTGPRRPDDEIDEQGVVIIARMGRFGQIVNRMVRGLGHRTVVLDSQPEVIERMRRFGIKAFLWRGRPPGAARGRRHRQRAGPGPRARRPREGAAHRALRQAAPSRGEDHRAGA